jgi:2-dehydro-3-deoxygalactonokinase
MDKAAFVAGDWGTTALRLFLCNDRGAVLAQQDGPGVSARREGFDSLYDSLIAGWTHRHGPLPAILCGMVGSSLGWAEAPYLECPVSPDQIGSATLPLRGGQIRIVPGLTCKNPFGAPDVLRGEETQILGALDLSEGLRSGTHLICLPGTHTKWALLQDSTLLSFLTAPTGEIFALLCNHSVLVRATTPRAQDDAAFAQGLAEVLRFPQAQILHRIFECRSRLVRGQLPAAAGASFLSGLLIGADVCGAMQVMSKPRLDGARICVVGDAKLARLYAQALSAQGHETQIIDGRAASIAGLGHVYRLMSAPEAKHARR